MNGLAMMISQSRCPLLLLLQKIRIFLFILDLILNRLKKQLSKAIAAEDFGAQVQLLNRLQKIYSFGKEEVSSEKDWKHTFLFLLNYCGVKNEYLKYILISSKWVI